MLVVSLLTGRATEQLTGRFSTVSLTVNRLTSSGFGEAHHLTQTLLRDDAQLVGLMAKHDCFPRGGHKAWKRMKDKRPADYLIFLSGLGVWISAVECASRGLESWTGVCGVDRKPIEIERDGDGVLSETSRDAIEVLMRDEDFRNQTMALLDRAARILLTEGEPSGASPSGSSERATTA
jgi:hypothetical protein